MGITTGLPKIGWPDQTLAMGEYGRRKVPVFPTESGQQPRREPSQNGSCKSLVLKEFFGGKEHLGFVPSPLPCPLGYACTFHTPTSPLLKPCVPDRGIKMSTVDAALSLGLEVVDKAGDAPRFPAPSVAASFLLQSWLLGGGDGIYMREVHPCIISAKFGPPTPTAPKFTRWLSCAFS